jgi:hypothetical protein
MSPATEHPKGRKDMNLSSSEAQVCSTTHTTFPGGGWLLYNIDVELYEYRKHRWERF